MSTGIGDYIRCVAAFARPSRLKLIPDARRAGGDRQAPCIARITLAGSGDLDDPARAREQRFGWRGRDAKGAGKATRSGAREDIATSSVNEGPASMQCSWIIYSLRQAPANHLTRTQVQRRADLTHPVWSQGRASVLRCCRCHRWLRSTDGDAGRSGSLNGGRGGCRWRPSRVLVGGGALLGSAGSGISRLDPDQKAMKDWLATLGTAGFRADCGLLPGLVGRLALTLISTALRGWVILHSAVSASQLLRSLMTSDQREDDGAATWASSANLERPSTDLLLEHRVEREMSRVLGLLIFASVPNEGLCD